MKKIFISVVLALLIGSFFAFYLYRNVNKNIESAFFDHDELTAFQVGVFQNKENAEKLANTHKTATVVEDGDFYRVYISILEDKDSIGIMQEHFKSENIKYYLKKISVKTGEFVSELKKYENILLKATEESTYDAVNKKILNIYERTL